MIFTDPILSGLVAIARDLYHSERAAGVPAIDPLPGDLVVAVEGCPHCASGLDPDAIGYLVAHGNAAVNADGSGPTREVWDIRTLRRGLRRWENVTFARVTGAVASVVEAMLRAP